MTREELDFDIRRKMHRKETTYEKKGNHKDLVIIRRYQRILAILSRIDEKYLPAFEAGYQEWVKR